MELLKKQLIGFETQVLDFGLKLENIIYHGI